jgi:hypothetical protein
MGGLSAIVGRGRKGAAEPIAAVVDASGVALGAASTLEGVTPTDTLGAAGMDSDLMSTVGAPRLEDAVEGARAVGSASAGVAT